MLPSRVEYDAKEDGSIESECDKRIVVLKVELLKLLDSGICAVGMTLLMFSDKVTFAEYPDTLSFVEILPTLTSETDLVAACVILL